MPKAISYIRFSAKIQEKGSSIERQLAMRDAWLEANPEFELSNLSEKDIAKSASKGVHLKHGLGRILQAIEQGLIKRGDYLIVESIDRLGRLDQLTMLDIVRDIVLSGVSIVTLEDNLTYSEESINSSGSPIYILVGKIQQSHEYTKALGRRIAAAYDRKREKARKGEDIALNTPVWLTSKGRLKPHEAAMVRESINLYLKGYGLRKITRELGAEYPLLNGISERTLKRWFNNPALIGQWKNKGTPINDVFEQLISKETYYALKQELKHRSKVMSPEQTYSLSGLVYCQQCGSRFYFRRKLYKGEYIVYANCSTYLKKGKDACANNTTWPYQVLEYFHGTNYGSHLRAASLDQVSNEAIKELELLVSDQEDNKRLMDNAAHLLINHPDNPSLLESFEALSAEDKSLRERVATLSEQLDNQDSSLLTAKSMADNYRFKFEAKLDPVYLRDILQKIGYKFTANGKTLSIEYSDYTDTTGASTIASTLTLLRRSTAHKCYIVEGKTLYKSNDIKQCFKTVTTYLAINKNGAYIEEETEQDVINELLANPNYHDAPNIQGEYERLIAQEALRRLEEIGDTSSMTVDDFVEDFPGEIIDPRALL